jgi:RNA polymerase sigma-70 factor, ECF subfamily
VDPASLSVTELLNAWGEGDRSAGRRFIELVYKDLRCLASSYMQKERRDHTLSPTALVHELYLRLFGAEPVKWNDRGHFFAVAARQLRHVIVDYARLQQAKKRGGTRMRIPFDQAAECAAVVSSQVLNLDEAITRLSRLDARAALVVELCYFGGLNHQQVGEALSISVSTVKRDWEFARVWLLREVSSRGLN